MPYGVVLTLVPVDNSLFCLFIITADSLCAFEAKVDVVTAVRFASAAHADVTSLIIAAAATSVAAERVRHAFVFEGRLNVEAQSPHINLSIADDQHRILHDRIPTQAFGSCSVLPFSAGAAPVHLRHEEIVVG